jgi:molybdopterin-guanine dinucleotide biosynthesis protein A
VVACDMPHLSVEFLSFLLSAASSAQADILLPLDRDGRPEPLCAVYARQCGAVIWSAVRAGVHKITEAFHPLRVKTLPFAHYAVYDRGGRLFANLNTPRDLEAALPAG